MNRMIFKAKIVLLEIYGIEILRASAVKNSTLPKNDGFFSKGGVAGERSFLNRLMPVEKTVKQNFQLIIKL